MLAVAPSRRCTVLAVYVAVAVLAGCGADDDDGGSDATTSAPAAATSSSVATTSTSVAATSSSVATTSAPPATTTAAPATASTGPTCPERGDTGPVVVAFPDRLSSLVGHDIRTGAHECFERVVLELGGDGELPGFKVEYIDDPVQLSPSDQTVEIAGGATLVLSVGAWMTSMEGDGYEGPQQLLPVNVAHIEELRLIENFEGMHAWAIGLDERRNFEVSTLADPPRLVIDVFAPNPTESGAG